MQHAYIFSLSKLVLCLVFTNSIILMYILSISRAFFFIQFWWQKLLEDEPYERGNVCLFDRSSIYSD